MPADKADARWSSAVWTTLALWAFMLMVFLPAIVIRHLHDDWIGLLLDCSTILVSTCLGLALFVPFRAGIGRPVRWRMAEMGVAILAASTVQTGFDLMFTAWVAQNLRHTWATIPVDFTRATLSEVHYLCVFTVNVALFQLAYSREGALRRERQLAAAETTAKQAQLEALRLQLNPHFLFNTLNAISSLIITRRNDEAEQMTDKLSSFLRTALTADPSQLVTVEEELQLIGDYLEIESVRFGERLRVDILCAVEARDVLVPAMLVQPLVENAIKYGVAPSLDPVTITIDAGLDRDSLCILVANDGSGDVLPAKTGGTGVGLVNIRRRLAALFGASGTLTAGPVDAGYLARICMPAQHGLASGRAAA